MDIQKKIGVIREIRDELIKQANELSRLGNEMTARSSGWRSDADVRQGALLILAEVRDQLLRCTNSLALTEAAFMEWKTDNVVTFQYLDCHNVRRGYVMDRLDLGREKDAPQAICKHLLERDDNPIMTVDGKYRLLLKIESRNPYLAGEYIMQCEDYKTGQGRKCIKID